MKFKLTKIGGGYHPILDIHLNGKKSKALIDTGANCTILTGKPMDVIVGDSIMWLNNRYFTISMDWIKPYPIKGVEVIIGTDILIKLGAIINYSNKTIVFKK